MTNFFKSTQFGEKEKELAASEGTYAFHAVCHNHSFKSMDCTSKLVQKAFEPKFSCARTKCEAIVVNVFSPWAMENLKADLNAANFVSVAIDASNYKEVKLYPVVVRYFKPLSGVRVKILKLQDLPGETAQIQFDFLRETLQKYSINNKLVSFCTDNANVNFGGAERRGSNNVFSKLNDYLDRKVIGVGCAAHIVHNAIRTSADCLPVDVETIITKIYLHFHIFTVRVQSLQEFCQFANVEYQRLLGYSATRWLALLPALERVLQIFSGLKSYFLSLDKCPTLLKNFFEDPTSEVWLYFVHNQAAMFHATVSKIESQSATFVEVAQELQNLLEKCQERLEQRFIPLTIRRQLHNLEEEGEINLNVENAILAFYGTCVQYLERWSVHFKDFEIFSWVTLQKQLTWNDVEKCIIFVNSIFPQKINDSDLFDELNYLKSFVTPAKIEEWNTKDDSSNSTDQKWVQLFHHFQENHVSCANLKQLVEFALSLPGTNAPAERIFSLVNNVWTPDKSNLKVNTLKDIVSVRCNIDLTCEKFYDMLLKTPMLLKAIHSSKKYQ